MNFNPTDKEIAFVNNALQKFNDEKVGPDNHELLNIVEYDNSGNIIAGILGGHTGDGCILIFCGLTKITESRDSELSF